MKNSNLLLTNNYYSIARDTGRNESSTAFSDINLKEKIAPLINRLVDKLYNVIIGNGE